MALESVEASQAVNRTRGSAVSRGAALAMAKAITSVKPAGGAKEATATDSRRWSTRHMVRQGVSAKGRS